MGWLLLFSFVAGVFTILSPCILPILPAILSAGTLKGTWRPFAIILGLVLSFSFFTLTLTAIVHATGISPNILRYLAIFMIAAFGLVMVFPKLSEWFSKVTAPIAGLGQNLQSKQPKSGFWSGLLFGAALGLVWTPCAGPILAAITVLVATQSITWNTVLITLAYSIGAGIPMFLIAYGSRQVIQSSEWLSSHLEGIRRFFGVVMILTAVAIALHWDMFFQQQISRIFPTVMIEDNALVKQQLDELQQIKALRQKGAMLALIPGVLSDYGPAPEIVGITNWLNSPPLSLKNLRGKVVMIDFWTYSCINCLRTLPYIKKWHEDYKDKGFVVIGVHTPEFEFEKNPMNVAEAAARLGVNYPIAEDNDYKTWLSYSNRYWPAHYLIDKEGNLRMVHFGEGGYVATENAIRQLLGMGPLQTVEEKKEFKPLTPEIYLGFARAKNYAPDVHIKEDGITNYTFSGVLSSDTVGLKGPWRVEKEKITAASGHSFLELNFLAGDVYLVLSGKTKLPIQVVLDGKMVSEIKMDGDRKYDIVSTEYGRHMLSLKIPQGVSAYAFTFGE